MFRATLLLSVGLSAWLGNAPACTDCRIEEVRLNGGTGVAIYGRIYLPAGAGRQPAVLVSHGYLANGGFMEFPWAEDLTRSGVVSLFLDRVGHGRSGGAWWPAPQAEEQPLDALHPEVHAALAYLRSRPEVDARRIAMLGHSDGATAAMVAASADWQIAATVSLSASLAPWEFVNHVVPRNLLLVYGREDRFILAGTDTMLIQNATRGYLAGEGVIGRTEDGSARKLVRVPGVGHVDVIWSAPVRREALAWFAATLALAPPRELAPLRLGWVAAGAASLLLLLALWNGRPAPMPEGKRWANRATRLLVLGGVWVGGLAVAAWVAPRLDMVPVQEGRVVAAVLAVEALLMGTLALLRGVAVRPSIAHLSEVGRGAFAGLLAQVGVEAVFRPLYATSYSSQRMWLALMFMGAALPALAATACAATLAGGGRVARVMAVEMVLGVLTATCAPVWFVRMSILPLTVLAFCLLLTGAYRISGAGTARLIGFGTVTCARSLAVVCAFY